ncbi:MAG: hypothetical protein JST32_08590, partial [Bacteroidetes bacterium]|nr:hypothetical protein [Bacteroidota bacterium]
PGKKQRLIFELSASEKEGKLKGVLADAVHQAALLNLPVVYRNELCVKPNLFIHKYPNGKKLLIEQDSRNSVEKTIRVLS